MEKTKKQAMTEAYITVLTNDRYLPGALVLANAIRDLGTTKRLAILVSNISKASEELVKNVYDEVINVSPIVSTSLQQLSDLGRPDLTSTYTKILIWKQIQFSRVVYLDSDILPVVPIDALFEIELSHELPIAASPDAGWPDIFNSGVFVTEPSESIFEELFATIQNEESPSFDGGDQGLLNEYFLGKWGRLPFTFNVTPTAGYQYVPAFLKFFKDIKIIHFIGLNKPWLSRDASLFASGSFGKGYEIMKSLHEKWWKVFNRHYFGKIAGEIFAIANISPIEDHSGKGEGCLLDIPKMTNQWDDLKVSDITNDTQSISEPAVVITPLFPWEFRERVEPERVFSESTDSF